MTLSIRPIMACALALAAIVAAIFIVKAVLAIATLVLIGVVAVVLFRAAYTFVRRPAGRKNRAIFRR